MKILYTYHVRVLIAFMLTCFSMHETSLFAYNPPVFCTGEPVTGVLSFTFASTGCAGDNITLEITDIAPAASDYVYVWESSNDGVNYYYVNTSYAPIFYSSAYNDAYWKCTITCPQGGGGFATNILFIPVSTSNCDCAAAPTAWQTNVQWANSPCPGQSAYLQAYSIIPAATNYQFQWESSLDGQNFSQLFGFTSQFMQFQPTTDAWYRCVISCPAGGSVTTIPQQLVFNCPPCTGPPTTAFTQVSWSSGPCPGDQVWAEIYGLSPFASNYTYQWETSIDGVNFDPEVGATLDQFSDNPLVNTWYRCVIACPGGSSYTSSPIQLTINCPTCTGPPTNVVAMSSWASGTCPGNEVLLGATALPNLPNYQYQWELSLDGVSFNPIQGASSTNWSDYPMVNTWYRCAVSCPAGGITYSNIEFVEIDCACNGSPLFVDIEVDPPSGFFCAGNLVTLTAYPDPISSDYTYQWQSSPDDGVTPFADIAGAIDQQYDFTQVASEMYYQCVVTCPGDFEVVSYSVLVLEENPAFCPCTGEPTAGIVTLTPGVVCANPPQQITLSINGSTTGIDLTYQWQMSQDNINWNNVAIGQTATLTATVNALYRCIVTCPNSALSDTSAAESVLVIPCYCTSGLYTSWGCNDNDLIHTFNFGGFSHPNTGCSGGVLGYGDFTGMTVPVTLGSAHNLFISTLYSSGERVKIWIDYNDNGSFGDIGELIYGASPAFGSGNPLNTIVHVPAGGTPGLHRMRVRLVYDNISFTSCSNHIYGEVHDYTALVNQSIPCNPPTALTINNVTNTTAQISWNASGTTATMFDIYVTTNAVYNPNVTATAPTYNDVSTNPFTLTNLTTNTPYYVWLRSDCGTGLSAWVLAPFFTTVTCAGTLSAEVVCPSGTATSVGSGSLVHIFFTPTSGSGTYSVTVNGVNYTGIVATNGVAALVTTLQEGVHFMGSPPYNYILNLEAVNGTTCVANSASPIHSITLGVHTPPAVNFSDSDPDNVVCIGETVVFNVSIAPAVNANPWPWVNPAFTYYSIFNDDNANGVYDVGIDAVLTSGSIHFYYGNHNFTWSTNQIQDGDRIGIYVWADNICAGTLGTIHQYTVNACLNPSLSASSSTICEGNSVTFYASPTGQVNYKFFNDLNNNDVLDSGELLMDNGSNPTWTTSALTNTTPNYYQIKVIILSQPFGPGGNAVTEVSNMIQLSVNPVPVVSIAVTENGQPGDGVICQSLTNPTTLTLTASATNGTNFVYYWNNPFYVPGAVYSHIPNISHTYTAIVTGDGGCVASASFVSEVNSNLQVAYSSTPASCSNTNNGSIDLFIFNGSTPLTYLWSNAATVQDPTGLAPGNYNLTITDNQGCQLAEYGFNVSSPAPIGGSTYITSPQCGSSANGAIDLSPYGGNWWTGYTYLWSNAATTEDISGLTVGTYTVTITDGNGCTGTASATITAASSLAATIGMVTQPVCANQWGAIEVVINGGSPNYTVTGYNPSYGNYSVSGSSSPLVLSGIPPGSYTITVTDGAGCDVVLFQAATLLPPVPINFSLTMSQETCAGASNGSITVTNVTGGTAPYAYAWSHDPALTVGQALELIAGVYTVTVTDANGCTNATSIQVTIAPAITVAFVGSVNPLCHGASTGSITVNASGGSGTGYEYATWLGYGVNPTAISSTPTISGLPAGNYVVTVTDNSGCTGTAGSFTISQPSPLQVTLDATSNVCAGASVGQINATPSGGTLSYSFSWSNGAITEDLSNIPAGTYTVTLTDGAACTATASVTIFEWAAINMTTNITHVTCSQNNNGAVLVSAFQGTAPYSFQLGTTTISNSAGSATFSNLAAGVYTVIVTDVNGCLSQAVFTVNAPSALSLSFVTTSSSCNGGNSGTVTANVSGGTPGYTYLWNPPAANISSLSGLAPGAFSLTVTDAVGCSITGTAMVSANDVVPPVVSGCPALIHANANNNNYCGAFVPSWGNPTATDNCAVVSFTNNAPNPNGAGSRFFAVGAHTITYIATDAAGNTGTCSFTVTVTDIRKPVMQNCPNAVSSYTQPNVCTGSAGWVEPTAYDNCGAVTVSSTHVPGPGFAVGATTVTYTATDAAGNTATCSFVVTITDNQSPTALCQDATVQLDAQGTASLSPAQVQLLSFDNCETVTSMQVTPSTFNCSQQGQYVPVTLTVNFSQGSTATCLAAVYVEDITGPEIVHCENLIVVPPYTGSVTLTASDFGISDNCDTNPVIELLGNLEYNCYYVGGTDIVAVIANDASGNYAVCVVEIEILDTLPPISGYCLPNSVFTINPWAAGGSATLLPTDLGFIDNCMVDEVTILGQTVFTNAQAGQTIPVPVLATDIYGNETNCTIQVYVFEPQMQIPVRNPYAHMQIDHDDLPTVQPPPVVLPVQVVQNHLVVETELMVQPNPATISTNIVVHVSKGIEAKLEIHELATGRVIAQLLSTQLVDAGIHQYLWQTANVVPGTYLAVWREEGRVVASKPVLVVKP